MLPRQWLKHKLVQGSVGSLVIKIASTALALGLAIVLARVLSPEGFGQYVLWFAVITLLSIPAQFGLPNLVIRETAKAQLQSDWPLIKGLWQWSTAIATSVSGILAIGAIVFVWITSNGFETAGTHAIFLWGLALIPLISLGILRGSALRGLGHVLIGQLPEFLLRPLFFLCLVLGFVFWPDGYDLSPAGAMQLHVVAAGLAFVIGVVLLLRYRPTEYASAGPPLYRTREWAIATIPLALLMGMQTINQNINLLMLGWLSGPVDVGIFRIVTQGTALIIFGQQAVSMAVMPQFARLHAQGDLARLQTTVTWAARGSLLIALPIALILIFFGETVLTLIFGPDYSTGHTALAIMAAAQLLNASMGAVGHLLNMTGHERDTVVGIGIATGCNVILNFVLIPSYGLNGAAVATGLSIIIWNLILWFAVNRRLGIESDAIGIRRQLFGSGNAR